jgi:iron complex outermembrane receptor protein
MCSSRFHVVVRRASVALVLFWGPFDTYSTAQSIPKPEATTSMKAVPTSNALEEVVITATPLRRDAFSTAQPASVISGDELVAALKNSLGETLAEQPGISASSFGPIASRPIIRGQGGLRVQTFADGADTFDAAALSDDHAVTLEPLLAERIEIVRGPAALLFGSAAAAGAVNVITPRLSLSRPAAALMGEVQARADTAANERSVAARVSGKGGEHLQFNGDLHHFRADDLSTPEGRLENSSGGARGASAGLGWTGDRFALALSVSELRSDYGLPGEDVRLALEQRRMDIAGDWRLNSLIDLIRFRAAHNDYGHTELEGDEVGTRYAQTGSELRLSAEREGRWIIGMQWREIDFDAVGDEAFLPTSITQNLGAFLFGQFSLIDSAQGSLALEAGLRAERQTIEVARPAPLASGPLPKDYADESRSSSIGLLWDFADHWVTSLQLTSTERHPTATELYAFGPHLALQRFEIGNAKLDIERGLTADLALRRRDSSGWHGSVGVFIADYDRFIAALLKGEIEDDLPVVEFAGIGAQFTGAEFDWSHDRIASLAAGDLGIRIFGDYVRARDDAGKPLPQIPPRRLGAETALTRGPLRVGLEAIWHDSQSDVAARETPTAAFTAINAEVAYRLPTAGTDILWVLRGVNLLDEEMRRHASPLKDVAPLAARHISISLQLKF